MLGRAPRASAKRSQMASFTFKATNWVLRSSTLVPLARTAILAPSAITVSQGSSRTPAYRASASRAATRPTVRLTRPASRDHRHTRRASSGAPKNDAPPDSGRTFLTPSPCSSSAKSFSAPGRHVAKNSKLCTWLVIIHSYEGRIEEFGQNGPRMSSHRTAGESSSAFYPINYRNTSNSSIRNS